MDENIRGNSRATAGGTREKVREKAAEVAGKAKDKIAGQYDAKKKEAMNEIQHLASALRTAADNVGTNGGSMSAMLLERAAERLDNVGSSFSGKDLDGIVSDVERLARRNPAVFLGGAMLIGFAASRFLKSSGRQATGFGIVEDFDDGGLPDYGADLRSGRGDFETTTGFGTTSPSTGISGTGIGGTRGPVGTGGTSGTGGTGGGNLGGL